MCGLMELHGYSGKGQHVGSFITINESMERDEADECDLQVEDTGEDHPAAMTLHERSAVRKFSGTQG